MEPYTVKPLTSIFVELTNECNLYCTICPVNTVMARGRGYMTLDLFKKTVDDIPGLEHIAMHNWGESLMNKHLFEMIDYAKKAGVGCLVLNTNATMLTERMNQRLLDSGLDILRFSLDGFGETYEKIRLTAYDKIESNILRFLKMNDAAGHPIRTGVVTVIDEQTEPVMDEFRKIWSTRVDEINLQPKEITSELRTAVCPELFGKDHGKLVILWNGDAVPCCVDYEGTLVVGNTRHESALEIWNGKNMNQMRQDHIDKKFPTFCATCTEYCCDVVEPRFDY